MMNKVDNILPFHSVLFRPFITMIPYLDRPQVSEALSYPALIDALKRAFAGDSIAPPRHIHTISEERSSSLLLMPVWEPNAHLGVKLVTVAPQNTHLPSVHAVFILFDATTGAPMALMDGEELTSRRTAAASALASSYASRKDSSRLLVVGTGNMARYLAVAHCHARDIKEIRVWGRSVNKAEALIKELRNNPEIPHGISISAVENLSTACTEADIISCATTSKQPLVMGSWIKPGTHVDLVGGFQPDMREADDALMAKATVFVDTYDGSLKEPGDILQPMANGSLRREAIVAELAALVKQRHPGRKTDAEITVFKSVGTALEDLCAANLAWTYHQIHARRD